MEERIERICDSINFNSSIPANMINNETLRYIFNKFFYPNDYNVTADDFSISEADLIIILPKIRDKFLRFCSDYPFEFKLIGTIILSLILLIGTIGNLLVIYVIVAIREMHTHTYFFLSSLAMADLLVLVSTIPVEITYFWFKNEFVFGELACRIHIYFAFLSINCSATNIGVVTFERYRAICYPFKTFDNSEKNEKTKKTKKYIFFIWLFNCVYNLFWFFLTAVKTNPQTTKPTCDYKWNRESYLFFFFFDLIIFYIVPLFLSAYMYTRIYHNLFKSLKFSKTSVKYPDYQVASRPSNNPTSDYCYESDNNPACSSYYSAGPDQNSNYNSANAYNDCDSRQDSSSLNSFSRNAVASFSGHKDSIYRKPSVRHMNSLHASQKNGGLGNKIVFNDSTKAHKSTVQPAETRGDNRVLESESDEHRKKRADRKDRKQDSMDRLRKESSSHDQKNKIVVLLFLIFVLFALLLLPYRGLLVYNSLVEEKILDRWVLLACKSLLSINSMINPILYNYSYRFRDGFKSALNKFFCFNFKSIRPNTQESYISSRT